MSEGLTKKFMSKSENNPFQWQSVHNSPELSPKRSTKLLQRGLGP